MLIPDTLFEIKKLETSIRTLKKQLSCLPAGTLHISHQGKHYYYRHHRTDGSIGYISKKDLSLARNLALRKYLQLRLEELESYTAFLKAWQSAPCFSEKADHYLFENEGVAMLLRDCFPIQNESLKCWASLPEAHAAPKQEQRIHMCRSGHAVRSKSEAIIDNSLLVAALAFHYEDPLRLGARTVYPDFTIRHPVTGDYVYWEHFGMMSDPAYSRAAAEKIALYARFGIIPFHNLITTFEHSCAPW